MGGRRRIDSAEFPQHDIGSGVFVISGYFRIRLQLEMSIHNPDIFSQCWDTKPREMASLNGLQVCCF